MSYSDINQFSQQCIRQVFTACFLLTGSFLIFNHVVFAHGVVHQRIDELTAQIQQSPDNTQLLFERGLLYADDQHWQNASDDFNAVRRLNPDDAVVDLHEAKMWFAANRPELAYPLVSRYLKKYPDSVAAHALRAKVNDQLGRSEAAVADFSRVVKQSKTLLPEMYLQWAQAQAKLKPLNSQTVLQIIQSGLDKLGPLVVLLKYAIDFDRQQQNYQSAMKWYEKLPQQLRQQPLWLVEKAELFGLLGRNAEAKAVYQLALDKIQEKRRLGRFNKADQILLNKIHQQL